MHRPVDSDPPSSDPRDGDPSLCACGCFCSCSCSFGDQAASQPSGFSTRSLDIHNGVLNTVPRTPSG